MVFPVPRSAVKYSDDAAGGGILGPGLPCELNQENKTGRFDARAGTNEHKARATVLLWTSVCVCKKIDWERNMICGVQIETRSAYNFQNAGSGLAAAQSRKHALH